MENNVYEINVYDWLVSELTKANEQLDSIWGYSLTDEDCDSLENSQFAIVRCIDVIKEIRRD